MMLERRTSPVDAEVQDRLQALAEFLGGRR